MPEHPQPACVEDEDPDTGEADPSTRKDAYQGFRQTSASLKSAEKIGRQAPPSAASDSGYSSHSHAYATATGESSGQPIDTFVRLCRDDSGSSTARSAPKARRSTTADRSERHINDSRQRSQVRDSSDKTRASTRPGRESPGYSPDRPSRKGYSQSRPPKSYYYADECSDPDCLDPRCRPRRPSRRPVPTPLQTSHFGGYVPGARSAYPRFTSDGARGSPFPPAWPSNAGWSADAAFTDPYAVAMLRARTMRDHGPSTGFGTHSNIPAFSDGYTSRSYGPSYASASPNRDPYAYMPPPSPAHAHATSPTRASRPLLKDSVSEDIYSARGRGASGAATYDLPVRGGRRRESHGAYAPETAYEPADSSRLRTDSRRYRTIPGEWPRYDDLNDSSPERRAAPRPGERDIEALHHSRDRAAMPPPPSVPSKPRPSRRDSHDYPGSVQVQAATHRTRSRSDLEGYYYNDAYASERDPYQDYFAHEADRERLPSPAVNRNPSLSVRRPPPRTNNSDGASRSEHSRDEQTRRLSEASHDRRLADAEAYQNTRRGMAVPDIRAEDVHAVMNSKTRPAIHQRLYDRDRELSHSRSYRSAASARSDRSERSHRSRHSVNLSPHEEEGALRVRVNAQTGATIDLSAIGDGRVVELLPVDAEGRAVVVITDPGTRERERRYIPDGTMGSSRSSAVRTDATGASSTTGHTSRSSRSGAESEASRGRSKHVKREE